MDLWCLSRSTKLPAGTTQPNEKDRTGKDQILAVDRVATDDHGACSLPRHTIRERID
jgi:hypothetical protein